MIVSWTQYSLALARANLHSPVVLPESVSWAVAVFFDLGVHMLPQSFNYVLQVGHHDCKADVISCIWCILELQGHC